MPTGRTPHPEKFRKKTFYLPESLITRVDLRLELDIARGTPRHGEWSALVNQLLREWVEKQQVAEREKGEQQCPSNP